MSKPTEESEIFYKKLQNTVNKINNGHKIVILGDLNARIGNEKMRGVKQRFNEAVINKNGELLIDFCARNEMRINNTFFSHQNQHKYTFNNTRGQRSTIDFIITNRVITPSQVLDVRALTSANIGTDHNLILFKILLERPQTARVHRKSTRTLFESRPTNKLERCNIAPNWDIEGHWLKIENFIEQAAEEAIGKRKININANNRTKPWFCQEVKQLADIKRSSYLKYKSRNRVNSKIKEIKREYWIKFTADMEYDMYGAQRNVWKLLKNRKKPVYEYAQTKEMSMETWEAYFRQLYKFEETVNFEAHETVSNATIDETEIVLRLKKLKYKKAAGPDNTPNELLKYGGQELTRQLCLLFNNILRTAQILKNKLEEHIEKSEEQQGFRRNRSTTDAIFIVKQIKEKAIEFNTPACYRTQNHRTSITI
ncbi:uncharacterized protein LOC109541399 [Dendroctonus ponderosae]|uniref:Endonuclease/exonuclease/phosphatase domain-containing protein n=1 Tax=Dendroctonus ponderosae TaxID=77166 RepID=A0AAR5PXV0_DENPD|nr:uncharacterized protein LOC109541399 [Dendroctonus ponderosae]